MKHLRNIIQFLFFFIILLNSQSSVSAGIPQVNLANKINGTFIDVETISELPNASIPSFFAELKASGQDTVVIRSIQTKPSCASTQPTWLPEFPAKLSTIFSQAAVNGIQVYVGLVASVCADIYENPNVGTMWQYMHDFTNPTNPIQYVVTNFGAHPNFAGWYIPDEPAVIFWPTADYGNGYYRNIISYIREKSTKPVLIAPSMCGARELNMNPSDFASKIATLKTGSTADIIVLQDCVNQNGNLLTQDTTSPYTTADVYRAVSQYIGQPALWADLETGNCCLSPTFRYDTGAYNPTNFARLLAQINNAPSTYVAKRVTWLNEFHMSQTSPSRFKGANRLYASYVSQFTNTSGYELLIPTSYSWTTSPNSQYPDTGNTEMFDHVAGELKQTDKTKFTGISGTAELIVNLGMAKTIQWVGAHVAHYDNTQIRFPDSIAISCSSNGTTWSILGTFSNTVQKLTSEYVLDNGNTPLNMTCSFLKITLANQPGYITLVSEIEIVATSSATTVTTTISPTPIPTAYYIDVPFTHSFYTQIEKLRLANIIGGCITSPPQYCPNNSLTRAEAAVILERVLRGGNYVPPETTSTFTDVPANYWAKNWIEQFKKDGITSGCDGNTTLYCPDRALTRAEAAIFLLKIKNGASYQPPNVSPTFTDAAGQWYEDWVEAFKNQGATSGCGTNIFCPNDPTLRGAIAVFVTNLFPNLGAPTATPTNTTTPIPPSCTSAGPAGNPNVLNTATTYDVFAYGVQNATSVEFYAWSSNNGQDDIRTYTGTNMGGGTWKATVNFANHTDLGQYNVHIYMNGGFTNFCGTANFIRSIPGDADGNNHVDGVDYVAWLSHYGQTISGVANGDFNGNGKVDGIDYVVWLTNYGR